jgi:ComF family protein
VCGRYIGAPKELLDKEHERLFCTDCIRKLPRTEHAVLRANSVEEIFRKIPHFEKGAAFLYYEKNHPIRLVMHQMKYADQPMIAYCLAQEAAREYICADFFDEIDVIIPVPLHKKRLRSRGYNQAEYIARALGSITGITVDTTHVKRVRNTPKQALQDKEGRKTNVADAFEVNHPEQMYHKHILVVDDLITTGETIKACIKAMRRFRGARFSVFALCKPRQK